MHVERKLEDGNMIGEEPHNRGFTQRQKGDPALEVALRRQKGDPATAKKDSKMRNKVLKHGCVE